ncbi:MAG: HU family DNA-binding protein [Amylibacter sp.]|nr:HU family DNA-binding protein [Amylibacter sp.]
MATAKKTKTPKKTALKTVSDTDTTALDVEASQASEENPVDPNLVKKKAIYEHVSVATGLRKRDVREAVDSLLEYLHTCLSDGKTIQLPPLGKIKAIERGSGDNAKTHYKLMLKKPGDSENKSA